MKELTINEVKEVSGAMGAAAGFFWGSVGSYVLSEVFF